LAASSRFAPKALARCVVSRALRTSVMKIAAGLIWSSVVTQP